MPSLKQTTVVLNRIVQEIKDELSPIYGLKNILSAGLILFSKLSATEQKKIISELNKMAAAERDAGAIVGAAEEEAARQKQKKPHRRAKSG